MIRVRFSLSTIARAIRGAALGIALVTIGTGAAAAAGDAAAGKAAYTANCASCHGDAGKGDGPVGAALNPKPRDFSKGDFKYDTDKDGKPGTDVDLKNIISKGAQAFGGSPLMAPWGGTLADKDIDNVVAFVRTLKK
jgi:mono/diheme cytochrome c family protein